MSAWYGIEPYRLSDYSISELSKMYRGMIKNKARERIHRIEDTHVDKLKDKKERERLLDTIFKQIDEAYKKPRTISEDELKKQLGSIFR